MQLDIWFDIDSPNSFLSIKQFFRLYNYMGYRFNEDNIKFRPLQLNPEVKTDINGNYMDGMIGYSYLRRRKKEKILNALIIQGSDEGIRFDFTKLFPLNTTKAIQMVLYVQQYEQEKVVDVLFKLYEAYFIHYKNIDHLKVLQDIGKKTNLNLKALQEVYEKEIYLNTIAREAKKAESLSIGSVPLLVFNNTRALAGFHSDDKVKNLIVDAHF